MKNTEVAFTWIIDVLSELAIPFQITGGLAAQLYGSKRPLADIDIDILESDMDKLCARVREHIVFGPAQYRDAEWDVKLMTLMYAGQDIDISAFDTTKIFDVTTSAWVKLGGNLLLSETFEVYGFHVPVITKANLLAYKKMLGREVDRLDVAHLEGTTTLGTGNLLSDI